MTFAPEEIATVRLELTPLRVADADEMVEVLADTSLYTFTGGEPPDPTTLRERYRALVAGSGRPGEIWLNWIVRRRDDARPVGTVQATVIRDGPGWAAEVAWVVGRPWQGRGYASEAAVALVSWLRERGAWPVTAHVHPDHAASAAVAARAGLVATADEVDGERAWVSAPPAPVPRPAPDAGRAPDAPR